MYEEMKEKYESGNYICLTIPKYADKNLDCWMISEYPRFRDDFAYKLIHKKHKNILDACLADNSVSIITDEDKQEISDQVDEISLNEQIEKQLTFKVSSSTILVGTGKDIANNIGNHLTKDYEYEIIIKQLKP